MNTLRIKYDHETEVSLKTTCLGFWMYRSDTVSIKEEPVMPSAVESIRYYLDDALSKYSPVHRAKLLQIITESSFASLFTYTSDSLYVDVNLEQTQGHPSVIGVSLLRIFEESAFAKYIEIYEESDSPDDFLIALGQIGGCHSFLYQYLETPEMPIEDLISRQGSVESAHDRLAMGWRGSLLRHSKPWVKYRELATKALIERDNK